MSTTPTNRLHRWINWRRWLGAIVGMVLGLQLWATPALATSVAEIPDITADPTTWVVDQGDVLSNINQRSINKALGQLAKDTGHEVRFVTIRRLDYGETPESFTDQLFERWFPQPDDQANQAILFLDTKTNGPAIRMGEQVEAALSDEVAQSLATESLLIPVREGNYNQGLLGAKNRVVAILSGQPDPGPPVAKTVDYQPSNYTKAEETNTFNSSVVVIVLLIVATVVPMATYYYYQNQ